MSAITSRGLSIILFHIFARAENFNDKNTAGHIHLETEIPATVSFSEIWFPPEGNGTYSPNVTQSITIKSDGHSKIKLYFTKFEMEFSAGYAYDGVAIQFNNQTHGFSGFAFQNEFYSYISSDYEYEAKVGDDVYFYQKYSVDYIGESVSDFVGFADGDVRIVTKTDPTLNFGGYKLTWQRVQ